MMQSILYYIMLYYIIIISCSTEDRAGGWIRLTREILKLPEAPSVASKGVLSKSSEKSSKARRPQPLIKLVMRRCVVPF